MNGVITQGKDSSAIDRKPVITCAGELEVFSGLEDSLSFALPQDSCEWRRSLGRPVRNVHIGVRFTPFSPEALPRENQWDLIRHPLFHVYWTECIDVDIYKTSVRDDIELWLKELNARNITDWLIVVVETFDIKRANKLLPRTTVLDKIRADFAPKQGDRCISVLNPSRQENRTADSWRGLVARVRYLVLVAYARAVTRLEEHVRAQRERRNEAGWHFIRYFRLQEELAQVLEMLGLHDEALVQYDELDALFSQFVVNGHAGDAACWLSEFQRPLDRWHGLKLELPQQQTTLELPDEPSLLELRAYLYAKQAKALLASGRPWEMAGRCLPFLHACVRELALLEVQATVPGAVHCWLFLAALEVLHACERRERPDTAAADAESYSLHTAALWAYAARKLRQLGELCGLLPGDEPTSEQLHLVVGLSSGMGDCPGELPHRPSPTDKLKEALCSQDAFNRHYLELSELAMGTYKHVGRLRSARLVGRELASFYRLLGETNKAAAFLGDALKTFEQENWRELAVQTQLELAACYLQADDRRRYVRACAAVSAAPEMDMLIRCRHFDDMLNSIDKLEKSLPVPFINIFKIIGVNLKCDVVVMQDSFLNIDLDIECNFPRKIVCSNLMISLENEKVKKGEDIKHLRNVTCKDMKLQDPSLQRLKIQKHLDYRQDKQIASASVVCKSAPLKRADSNAKPARSDFVDIARPITLPVALTPGLNQVQLQWKCGEPGKYFLGQVLVQMGFLEFLSLPILPKLRFEVKREEPSLRLDKTGPELLAGLPQTMQLTVTIGSYSVEPDSVVKISSSKGLTMQHEDTLPLAPELIIPLGVDSTLPHSRTSLTLRVFSKLPARDHLVQLICPWAIEPLQVPLGFSAPITTSWRLHTAKRRKFAQVLVTGQCATKICLEKVTLSSENSSVKFQDLNPTSEQAIISNGLTISYMWEILVETEERKPLKTEFNMEYAAVDDENSNICTSWRQYKYNFDIADYETLYLVEAKVEPTKGSEFCRVGALCHLRLSISPALTATNDDLCTRSLMYEVLAEQSVWAVCGRTAGVVSVAQTGGRGAAQLVTLDVMPLASGYLPLPLVRLSKYIPADKTIGKSNPSSANAHPRLEPFSPGQVYNGSKGQQIHVLAAANELHIS